MIDRFYKYIKKNEQTECWEWIGANTRRYGIFWDGKRYGGAHRISYKYFVGEIKNKLQVCHSCDNSLCVNPKHLFLGTQSDNIKDCVSKGRLNRTERARGEKSGRAVLSEELAMYVLKSNKQTIELSKEIGISFSTLSSLRTGRSWKHLHERINNER